MASVPRRESQAAVAPRPQPPCACGRGNIHPMSAICAKCTHENAVVFWKLMGLPGIPTELPKAAVNVAVPARRQKPQRG